MTSSPVEKESASAAPGNEFASALKISGIGERNSKYTRRAVLIHNQTVEAISNFDRYYVNSQKILERTGKVVGSADDLLRAMLSFACSGLDAVVKQLVQDSLERILRYDEGAQNEFKKFVERRLKRSAGDDIDRLTVSGNSVDAKLVAELMVSFDPRSKLVAMLTRALTDDSLQSKDQLLKVAAHFALGQNEVMANPNLTKSAFHARNQIVHEMDVDLDSGNARRARDYKLMVDWCDNILKISVDFIAAVEGKVNRNNRLATDGDEPYFKLSEAISAAKPSAKHTDE